MHRAHVVAVAAAVVLGWLAGFANPAIAQSVAVYEGARLIVGDGSVIENGALVVEGAKITQAGRSADVARLPAPSAWISPARP